MGRKKLIKFRPVNRQSVNVRVYRYRRINSILAERRAEAEAQFINHSLTEDFDTSQESSAVIDTQKPLEELLRSWINYHRITTRAVNDLLKILKKSGINLQLSIIDL